ncbi:DNA-directed RNA polymerase subunit A' [Candidatus Pacearchaeota archaeon]|nr:MAG: DNA-directed RNA polymerase subunit A' [Candidatus Pacearchaeota archaeon]
MNPIKKKASALSFHLLSPEQIKKLAVAKIVTPELYDVDGYPVDGGLMDLRLGAIDPGVRCRTCGGRLKECLGHPGMIELARPVIHIKYVPIIDLVLRSTCEACGRILIKDEKDLKKDVVTRIKKARDVKKCPHCGIVQEKIKLEKPTTFKSGKRRLFPSEIRERLVKVPDEDLLVLGINSKNLRPEWAVLTVLLVPPVTVRPSITLESGERSEDDLTHKLSDIIRSNQRLWENLNAGAPEVIVEDLWDLLQYHITTFFDNSIARVPPARHRSGQPLKTITERIKGKEGRIRKNLAGKRVNFSSRTVISPDPNLKLNEVGVPLHVAKILTVAEKVTNINIERLRKIIMSKEYPGANYIIRPDGKRKRITDELREDLRDEIGPGYIVERHLVDGDVVLFNRHPSLHRVSLMAHFVKVLPGKTFRMHPAVCNPYNADFDGDEMNVHAPQTEEARAEAKILLNVDENIFSPKNGMNLMGCVRDAVTGNYLLKDFELSKEEASELLYLAGKKETALKNKISGEELFKKVLPKEVYGKAEVHAGFRSEKGELLKFVDKEFGRAEAVELLRKIFALGTVFLSRHGFTLGVSDLGVSKDLKEKTNKIIEKAEEKTQKIIEAYYNGELEALPGKTLEETREIKILQVLNETRTDIGEVVKQGFSADSPASKIINSGAGASMLHITQIACSVGQQVLNGRRIDFGYTGRTLSFFKKGDLSPRARGFIYSSFKDGLRPDEFFFGAITGRDGLMDTALRTPKSGYLYRRLSNALQDLIVAYDGTVRDASDNIIQFKYGGDGGDVSAKHLGKNITPGESIGIVTAQSFGESATQMVLNVFHAAGVAEMQVTQGLPRFVEIFDARKEPKTPSMEIYLDKEHNNEKDARVIAEKLKEIKLVNVLSGISIDFGTKQIHLEVDSKALKSAHVTLDKVISVLNDRGFSAKKSARGIVLDRSKESFREIYKEKEKIKKVTITGVKGISQVLVVKRERNYVILTAGSNLKALLKFPGVDHSRVFTNDIHEVSKVLGIEAARQAIIDELLKATTSQGLNIDLKHFLLVADAMTNSGTFKGITRMGIISDKSSILARASFETPIRQFIQATKTGKKDKLASVIENIILNQPVPVGTGLPGLLVKVTGPLAKKGVDGGKSKV